MTITKKKRAEVATRARHCCEYCQCQEGFSPAVFSVEHVFPLSKGGGDDLNNLAYACQGCNNFKYNFTSDFDPVSGQIASIFNPRVEKWDDHFTWNEDYTLIIARTPVGRVTIERLQLNRKGVVNIRTALRKLGLHPPS